MFNASMFQPVSQLAQNFGVKAVIHGGPGTGKTPLLLTAPEACFAFSEPGLRSVRNCQGPGVIIDTYAKMKDYMDWCTGSMEARRYHVKCFDSISQMAEIILAEAEAGMYNPGGKPNKDPRQNYGEVGQKMIGLMTQLFFAPGVHAIMIAKRGSVENEGVTKYRPYFPGEVLNVKIPHLFDSVWSLERGNIPGVVGIQRFIRTVESPSVFARERSGNLAEYEQPDLRALIEKSMQ
jgi:hypothetical protein